jgi:hypothetical protein
MAHVGVTRTTSCPHAPQLRALRVCIPRERCARALSRPPCPRLYLRVLQSPHGRGYIEYRLVNSPERADRSLV